MSDLEATVGTNGASSDVRLMDDRQRDEALCDLLNSELICALGCTEPIAVA